MREYLVCVDSDGCAMDTMTIKHVKCFGPCLVKEWQLEPWKSEVLNRWNEMNLYSKKRGINRFAGLAQMLTEIDAQYMKIQGLQDLKNWVENTPAFSEAYLSYEIEKYPEKEILRKALMWSRSVNQGIHALQKEEKIQFQGVKEALEAVKEKADLAIVSSANREAMEEEWERCGIMQYVNYSMAQDVGTKAACIQKMIQTGYEKNKILMLGDAKGDYDASVISGVPFFPILAGKEKESWSRFRELILDEFLDGLYTKERQQEELRKFNQNLKED